MKNDPANIAKLLRRAVQSQVEMGMGELIVERPQQAMPVETDLVDRMDQTKRVVQAINAIGTITGGKLAKQFSSLEDHFQAICNCQACPLGATRNKFVYGVGNVNADVMFIGEGPGAKEDELGEPFVGRAGQLLDKILAAIDFSRETIYIANIVKCRPPGNRDPQPDEMQACFPHLNEQIRLIEPKLICCLGRIAAQALLQTNTPLGKLRNIWHEYQGVETLVTYHPAALLRFPAYKKETWADVQKLRARYDELTSK